MTPRHKVTKARALLIMLAPFFGTLALRLIPVETPEIETMAVDGVHLFYNPDFVDTLPMAELIGVVAHEVMHVALLHFSRRNGRDLDRWNQAGDYAINPILLRNNITLPKEALNEQAYAGLSTEAIYARLPTPQAGASSNQSSSSQNNTSPSQPGSQSKKNDSANPTTSQRQSSGPSTGTPKPRPGQTPADPTRCGAVIDGPPPGNATCRQLEADWKVAVTQAAAFAKAAGRCPGGIESLVENVIHPKLDYPALLRRFVTETAHQDYSWSPPNRRHIAAGLYLPSLRSMRLDEIVIGFDTSGSIRPRVLAEFLAHINAILEDAAPSAIHVVQCDTKVHTAARYTADDLPIKLTAKGRGGTSFVPVFEWIEKENITPACLIYLTDLECDRFPTPPPYPVLWAATKTGHAPFGEIVDIHE